MYNNNSTNSRFFVSIIMSSFTMFTAECSQICLNELAGLKAVRFLVVSDVNSISQLLYVRAGHLFNVRAYTLWGIRFTQ